MKGFYKLDYVPNKLAYVYEVTKTEIAFLAFFNEGSGMKAVKHSVSKKLSNDFKKHQTCFNPISEINNLITEALNN
jgi:hypothetical protein